jgi:biopolymer transport protein ExbD
MSPLIDVIFLLLMFYAVTTQFVPDQRLKLDLPEAKTAEESGQTTHQQTSVVTVANDGSVWINDNEVSDEMLEAALKRLVESAPDRAIILKGDREANYGTIVKVLDILRDVGASSLQMSAVKPPAGDKR